MGEETWPSIWLKKLYHKKQYILAATAFFRVQTSLMGSLASSQLSCGGPVWFERNNHWCLNKWKHKNTFWVLQDDQKTCVHFNSNMCFWDHCVSHCVTSVSWITFGCCTMGLWHCCVYNALFCMGTSAHRLASLHCISDGSCLFAVC